MPFFTLRGKVFLYLRIVSNYLKTNFLQYKEILLSFEIIMKRLQSWSEQKKTGAVKRRIRQEWRSFLVNNDKNFKNDRKKSSSYDDIRLDSVVPVQVKNKEDFLQSENVNCHNTINFGQVRVDSQQGSVEQELNEIQVSHNVFDSLPLSESEGEEEEEEKTSDIEKITTLTKKLKKWSLENNITQTALKQLLLILNEGYLSTSLLLPKDPRAVLRTPREISIKNIEGGQYWHHGITEPLMKLVKDITPIPKSINVSFNFDGLPIFKSAKKEFWPILANVEGSIFTIGIYYGTGKPKKLDEYLEDFVTEMRSLVCNGIIINDRVVAIKIKCFVCDSPARAFIKGVCNFNGKHGCLKCTTVGEYSHTSHTVFFSTKEESPRTDEYFRAKMYGGHHKIDSPLLQLPIDMVEDFPVADSLHLIDLGIMKRLLVGWRDGNFGTYMTKLCARNIVILDVFLEKCKLPSEIHRAVRSIDCLAHWKASEFRTFFHYLSVIILPDILRVDVVEHFLNIFCSITICSSECYTNLLPFAREMLKHFVDQYKYYYGSHYITSNVHNLLHVVDEVQKFGPLHKFNAYPFENQLYLIKRMLRQGDKPLAQVARRICEIDTIHPLMKAKSSSNVPYLTTSKNKVIVHYENFVLSLKPEDKYFMTHNEDIFKLKDLSSDSEKEVKIRGKKILNKDVIFEIPIKSSFLGMYKVKEPYVVSDNVLVLNSNDIKCKLVCVSHKDITYFLPLLHML